MVIQRHTARTLLLALGLTLPLLSLSAQFSHLGFEYISGKEGLPANKVTCIAKDSLGFYWYGTILGLVRHDGLQMDVFTQRPDDPASIPSGNIRSIYVDPHNLLWIVSHDGYLFTFDYRKERLLYFDLIELPYHNGHRPKANVIADSGQGEIFIFCDDGEWFILPVSSGGPAGPVRAAPASAASFRRPFQSYTTTEAIWLGTATGLFQAGVHDKTLELIDLSDVVPEQGPSPAIGAIAPFGESSLLLGSEKNSDIKFNGLIEYNYRTGQVRKLKGPVVDVYDLESRLHQIIYPISEYEFFLLPESMPPIYYHFGEDFGDAIPADSHHKSMLNTISMTCFFLEPDGRLIIGSNQGLFVHDPFSYVFKEFYPYSKEGRYPNRISNSYHDEKREQLVMVSNARLRGYHYALEKVTWEISLTHIKPHHLQAQIPELVRLSDDTLLILSSCIYLYDLQENRLHTVYSSFETDEAPPVKSNRFPYAFAGPDNRSQLFFFRDGCLYDIDLRTMALKRHTLTDEHGREAWFAANSMTTDAQGALWWTAVNQGLFMMKNPETGQVVSIPVSAPGPDPPGLNDLHFDASGVLWLATNQYGILRCTSDQDQGVLHCTVFGLSHGLSSARVIQLQEDDYNRLWMHTNYGISVFDKVSKVFRNYSKLHGINNPHNMMTGKGRDEAGYLHFSEGIAIIRFSPAMFEQRKPPPPVYIKSFSINNQPVRSFWQDTTIRLSWKQNDFSFSICAVNHSHAFMNRYAYKLENYHDDWIMTDKNDLEINFNNLPSGKYIFRAKAANHEGAWNETGINIGLTVSPPFWRTWWFRTCCLAAVIGGTMGLFRYRINQIRRQEMRLITREIETQTEERKRIARDLHDDIGAQLSILKMYIETINRDIQKKKDVSRFSADTRQMISRTIEDMRTIITELSPQSLSAYGYAAAVQEYLFHVRKSFNVEIALDLKSFRSRLNTNEESALFRITQELFNNSLKHAAPRHIDFAIREEGEAAVLTFKDDGKGFNQHQVVKGRGLYNINSRVSLLQGKMTLTSQPGKGTQCVIRFPNPVPA